MKRLALITLNSGGTKGHSVPLRNIGLALRGKYEVLHCAQEGEPEILLPYQPTTHSIGGCFEYKHYQSIPTALKSTQVDAAVFSTFFDFRAVNELTKNGIKAALLTYPLRDAHAVALQEREYLSQFGAKFIYEDFYSSSIDDAVTVQPLVKKCTNDSPSGILVTCGGGGLPSGDLFFKLMQEAIPQLLEKHPHLKFSVIDRLKKFNYVHDRCNVLEWTSDLASLIAAHKFVVSEAGYHTTAEIAISGRRAVLIPGARRIDNQELRAVRFEQAGFGSCVFPEEGVGKIVYAIEKELDKPAKMYEFKSIPVNQAIGAWIE